MTATKIPRSRPRLTAADTVPDLGEPRPRPDPEVLMLGPRPVELDDPVWLRAQARAHGDRAIAQMLGTTRDMVRGARRRWGIETQPGRRRGFSVQPVSTVAVPPVYERVVARYEHERALRDGPAPSPQLVGTRARDVLLAFHDGAEDLIDEALEALAVAALLALDHEHARRAA